MLTIVIINHKEAAGLQETWRSVAAQTQRQGVEVVVIDAHPTPESRALKESITDEAVRWVEEAAEGKFHAMNRGAQMAQGKYCLFLPAGARLSHAEVIEKVLPCLQSDKDFYLGTEIVLSQTDQVNMPLPEDFDLGHLLDINGRQRHFFVRTELLRQRPFDESYPTLADWETLLYWLIVKNSSYSPLEFVISFCPMKENPSSSPAAQNLLTDEETKRCLESMFSPRMMEFLHYEPQRIEPMALAMNLPPVFYRKLVRAAGKAPLKRDFRILGNVCKLLLCDLFRKPYAN